jgi:NDP-sugar pyrophosphorylase family protein
VAGKPFICRQVEYLRRQGIDQVVICSGYLGEQIADLLGDGGTFGLQVRYSSDWPALLGTGGAVRRALPLLGEFFFVLYGDSYVPCDFAAVQRAFQESAQPALLTVLRNENRWDRSNVLFEGGRVVEYNKRSPRPGMKHIDYGLAVLSAPAFRSKREAEAFDLGDVYVELSRTGCLAGLEVEERFYEIGSHSGLEAAEVFFRRTTL